MSEQPSLPPPDQPTEPIAEAPPSQRRYLIPWLCGLGFIVLTIAIFYVWYNPITSGETAAESAAQRTIEERLSNINGRLDTLEKRPVPDLTQTSKRLDAMDGRIGALDGRVAGSAQVASQLDTLSGRIQSLSAREQSGLDASKKQIDALTARVSALESNTSSVDAVAKRLNRIAMIQEASIALASGRPIGPLPDAPEALKRYVHSPPPTVAKLRLMFPHAEQAALAAEQPDESSAPFISRVWDRAQGLVTVRQGENIIVGDTSAVILGHARAALDAGDLSGAVDEVSSLKGAPAQAMADWLADAKSLLSARSALANMADHA